MPTECGRGEGGIDGNALYLANDVLARRQVVLGWSRDWNRDAFHGRGRTHRPGLGRGSAVCGFARSQLIVEGLVEHFGAGLHAVADRHRRLGPDRAGIVLTFQHPGNFRRLSACASISPRSARTGFAPWSSASAPMHVRPWRILELPHCSADALLSLRQREPLVMLRLT